MNMIIAVIVSVLASGLVGAAAGYIARAFFANGELRRTKDAVEGQLRRAESRSREILVEAKEGALQIKSESQQSINNSLRDIQRQETQLETREDNLRKQNGDLKRKFEELESKDKSLEIERDKVKKIDSQQVEALEKISNYTAVEAKEILIDKTNKDIEFELAKLYKDAETEMYDQADEKAKEILASSMQRFASEVVGESSVSSIELPNEEMKGRIIGREGRNIRALENFTGVDLIVDEEPKSISISCFDPIRKQTAVVAVNSLIKDGRIHPARIEELVDKAKNEVNREIKKAGQKAVFDTNIKGLNGEIIELMGRLKFRYSYGENVLQHSIEVGRFAGIIGAQIGLDEEICKTAGFLHDLGKALTHEIEGPHAEIGADVAERNNLPPTVVTAIREHHDREMSCAESYVVAAADAISAARPGARNDSLERYIERLTALEEIALAHEGVQKCYAIQAGREVRVMVDPDTINDIKASSLARSISEEIKQKLNFPGQIKIIVIRETRAVETTGDFN
ncbi:MAG: ribonuclease Y [Dehalococcoidia bacterium]|nr:MAG: ribonuclease Y [Chloroflexota bacterium]